MVITEELSSSNHATILKLKLPAVGGTNVESTTGIGLYRGSYGMNITGGIQQNVGAYGTFTTVSNGTPTDRIRLTESEFKVNP